MADEFEFAGFRLGMDLDGLRTRYPISRHEFWAMPSGRISTPDENVARFRALLTQGTGSYVLRVSLQEVVEEIFYVQVEREVGHARRLTLRFEVPLELRASRPGPSCDAIRRRLTERDGPPARIGRGYYEEAVYHQPIVWQDDASTLTWDCGEYAIQIRPR